MHVIPSIENHSDEFRRSVETITDMQEDLSADGLFALGFWLQGLNEAEKAAACYQKLLHKVPDFYQALFNMGVLHFQCSESSEAIEYFQKALSVNADLAEAWSAIGIIHCDRKNYDQALVFLDQALAIQPKLAAAHFYKGVALQNNGRYHDGLQSYQKAMACDPGFAPAHWLSLLSLPILYDNEAQIDHYRRQFAANMEALVNAIRLETAEDKKFALEGIRTGTNFYLQYQCRDDRALQSLYGGLVHKVMAANYPEWAQPKSMPPLEPGEKIRIGYVSSFMFAHTVGVFLSGWVEHHNRSDFEIHCYHMGDKIDGLTEHIGKNSHAFHCFKGDVEAAARRIEADQMHILVHTDIGMFTETMELAALRLAPVQCKGWGHPVTTGLPTMDYYLTSDLMEAEQGDQFYSETLIRLPNLALCYKYQSPPKRPKTRNKLGIPEDRFVYLSTQSLFKYLPQHDDIYPRIAREVPNALFIFIANPSQKITELLRERLLKAFRRHGLDGEQYCHFSPRLNGNDFLSLNLAADVLLDTLEWSGGKTTLEAMGCGLPPVTLPGRFMRGRHTYAMLKMIGLSETTARDKSDYCDIAIRLANDRTFYSHIKVKLRNNHYKLYEDKVFIDGLEDFYRSAVYHGLKAQ